MERTKFENLRQIDTREVSFALADIFRSDIPLKNLLAATMAGAYVLDAAQNQGYGELGQIDAFLGKEVKEQTTKLFLRNYLETSWDNLGRLLNRFQCATLQALILFGGDQTGKTGIAKTPEQLAKLAAGALDIRPNQSIADLGCGVGTFACMASVEYDGSKYFGLDINTDAIELARLKELVLKNGIVFEQGDIFARLHDKKFDRIFCDPPMGRMRDTQMRTAIAGRNPKMADRFKAGSQWFYAAAAYEMLNANGKAAVILPIGATWNTADADVRQFLLRIGAVEAVIELPQKIFDYTAIATVMVLLSHHNTSVRMVNAKDFCERGRRINELSNDNITTILECLHSDTEQSKLINLAEISAEGWVLSPTRFLTEKVEIGESIPFGDVIKSITRGAPLTAADLDSLVSDEPTDVQHLMLGNIKNGLIDNELPYLTELDSKYEKFLVQNNSLLLSKNGAPFKVAIAQVAPGKKILANGNLFVIELDEEKADPYCVKAFLESEAGTALLRSIAVGSAMPNISLDALRKLPIPKLPMEQQKRIREKYMTVSDKIVLLRRQLNKATDELGHIFDTESQNC